ncbi:MAG TPA: hypothetical protein VJT31_37975, partial [Rugosimonospora sp.]|nr:hypothetical protein [Rugosimonospora sp.]
PASGRPASADDLLVLPPNSAARATHPMTTDDVLALQRVAGNQATGHLLDDQRATGQRLTAQRQPDHPVTADSVRAALDQVTVESTRTTQVATLKPWVIFETLPWNPTDGKKSSLFSALSKAHRTLAKAKTALADAQRRAATAPPGTPAPGKKRGKKKTRPRGPSVADAQAAVDRAEAKVVARTGALKEYVKGKLGSSRNPRTAAARSEKADAAAALRTAEAQLSRARRARRPDASMVAELTRQRDEAKARAGAAAERLTALLGQLRAEIDAADWGMHDVDRTTTVYRVDGARATVFDRVEAYATVTAGGLEGRAERTSGGGPTVPELLAKDPTLGPSTRKILAIISRHEGDFTSVNTWDIADVTFGMVQWTTGDSGRGDLIRALTIMKQAAPDAFADRLGRYGIDVAPTGLVLTRPDGSVLTGVPAAKAVQADTKLTAVLAAAGTDPALQAAELRAANEIEVQGALTARLSVRFPGTGGGKAATVRIPVAALVTSEFGVGVLANHTVHGGFPKHDLEQAANAFVAAHHPDPADVATWGPQAEDGLVKAISKGADAKRIEEMHDELDRSPGSFH